MAGGAARGLNQRAPLRYRFGGEVVPVAGRWLAANQQRKASERCDDRRARGTATCGNRLGNWMRPNTILVLPLLCAAAACGNPTPVVDGFEATGRIIAFGGGHAGARAACVTCHGIRGEGDGNLVPRLAGLDPGYTLRQLENFANGARRHPQMEWISDHLDRPGRQRVADYYAELPKPARAASAGTQDCAAATIFHEGAPALDLPSCASCHGSDGAGNPGNPPLAGQPAPYLAAQLDAWASGERYGDPGGAMTAISRSLPVRDRQAVAEYAAALPGAGGDRSLPAACLRTRRPDR